MIEPQTLSGPGTSSSSLSPCIHLSYGHFKRSRPKLGIMVWAVLLREVQSQEGILLTLAGSEICSVMMKIYVWTCRYPPHGPRTIVVEDSVPWSRLRSPPIDTSAHELHVSDCLEELRPGDHVEVQWRRNKEFPYGKKRSVDWCVLFYPISRDSYSLLLGV